MLQQHHLVGSATAFLLNLYVVLDLRMLKSNYLILQLVLKLAWGGFASLPSQIKCILSMRKWLFMLTMLYEVLNHS